MSRAAAALIVAMLPLTARAQGPSPQPPADRGQVIATVQKLFEAMAAHDVEGVRRIMIPEGRLMSVNDASPGPGRIVSNQDFAAAIGARKETLLERVWNPEVRVHGGIAAFWAPYDFHLDGKFSHCGIDAFDLVKTAEGWKIAGGVYTVERTGCAPSPLGEPK